MIAITYGYLSFFSLFQLFIFILGKKKKNLKLKDMETRRGYTKYCILKFNSISNLDMNVKKAF